MLESPTARLHAHGQLGGGGVDGVATALFAVGVVLCCSVVLVISQVTSIASE